MPNRTKSERLKNLGTHTKISVIEKKFNVDLGVRSDMELGTFLQKKGFASLSKLLKNDND